MLGVVSGSTLGWKPADKMRLGEKQPATVGNSVGESSTAIQDLVNVPEVCTILLDIVLQCRSFLVSSPARLIVHRTLPTWHRRTLPPGCERRFQSLSQLHFAPEVLPEPSQGPLCLLSSV